MLVTDQVNQFTSQFKSNKTNFFSKFDFDRKRSYRFHRVFGNDGQDVDRR